MSARVSDIWNFKKNEIGGWAWERQSRQHEPLQQGDRSFETFGECVVDARRFGYDGSTTLAEPPRDPSRRSRRLKG